MKGESVKYEKEYHHYYFICDNIATIILYCL